MTLRLLSYNIRFGGGGREQALANTIRAIAPDVVLLQEATRPDVVAKLAATTGMTNWGSTPGHSVGFMSRIGVAHYAWHKPRGCRRALLELVLSGSGIRIFGVHLSAMHSNWMEQRRVRELTAMLASIEDRQKGTHFLAGDFNTLAPGEKLDFRRLPPHLKFLSWIGGRSIRWQTVQIMIDSGYIDGFRELHPDDKGYTFPTYDPHVRLDYVFVPGADMKRLRSCEVVNGPVAGSASDHFPLLAELEI